jgi:murein DD-endopeptidase MepM/ murein hydrolase activator NlpD
MVRGVPSVASRRRGRAQEAGVPPSSPRRRVAAAALVVVLALVPVPPAPAATPPGGAVSVAAAAGRVPPLRLPVRGVVVRGFEAPAGPFGRGHRGIDVRAPVGTPVAAPAAGTVTFAGRVAGSAWVSVAVAPGVVVTVGPLLAAAVAAGDRVAALAPVGRLAAGHGDAVHLSLRVDGGYVDPLPWLVDRPRPRLAPLPATTA